MNRRLKRVVRATIVIGVIAAYWQAATLLERRAIEAQRPTKASGAGQRYVDRDRLMADVTLLASAQMDGRRTGTPGGRKAREWIASEWLLA